MDMVWGRSNEAFHRFRDVRTFHGRYQRMRLDAVCGYRRQRHHVGRDAGWPDRTAPSPGVRSVARLRRWRDVMSRMRAHAEWAVGILHESVRQHELGPGELRRGRAGLWGGGPR